MGPADAMTFGRGAHGAEPAQPVSRVGLFLKHAELVENDRPAMTHGPRRRAGELLVDALVGPRQSQLGPQAGNRPEMPLGLQTFDRPLDRSIR